MEMPLHEFHFLFRYDVFQLQFSVYIACFCFQSMMRLDWIQRAFKFKVKDEQIVGLKEITFRLKLFIFYHIAKGLYDVFLRI